MRLNGISGSTFNKAVGRVVVEESDDSDDSHGEEAVPDLPKASSGASASLATAAAASHSAAATASAAHLDSSSVAKKATADPFVSIIEPSSVAHFKCFHSTQTKNLLKKWGLSQWMDLKAFRLTRKFVTYPSAPVGSGKGQHDSFLLDLFNSVTQGGALQVATKAGMVPLTGRVAGVTYSHLAATVTNMKFFDRLKQPGLVSAATGSIHKCMEEFYEGMVCQDRLRELFLNPDESEHADLFTDDDSEFLLHVFKRLVVGGAMVQFEDKLQPYLDITKGLYKDLMTVYRSSSTGKVVVATEVFEVTALTGPTGANVLFPVGESRHNFCYVVVNPLQQTATLWYGAHVPFW